MPLLLLLFRNVIDFHLVLNQELFGNLVPQEALPQKDVHTPTMSWHAVSALRYSEACKDPRLRTQVHFWGQLACPWLRSA